MNIVEIEHRGIRSLANGRPARLPKDTELPIRKALKRLRDLPVLSEDVTTRRLLGVGQALWAISLTPIWEMHVWADDATSGARIHGLHRDPIGNSHLLVQKH